MKKCGLDGRLREPLQAEVRDVTDPRLEFLQSFGDMCLKMAGRQGKRVRQLSKDTAVAMYTTCMGLVELAKHLIESRQFQYVCLGEFTTDPLEKAFGKLRQGSGGSYFTNAQQVSQRKFLFIHFN